MSPSFVYIEDDPTSREVLQMLLRNVLGYQDITLFEDSAQILERLRALPTVPDVMFIDIQITPHSGHEILRMLRSDSRYDKTIAIAMTASVMAADVQELKRAGFDGLIAKPIRNKIFPELLRRILNGEEVWFIS